MLRRSLLAIGFAAFALASTGCGPAWHVITQAAPDPFLGQHKFAVVPIDYAGLHVGSKSEADYLAGKDDKQQASFAGDKDGINDEFTKSLVSSAHDQGIEIALATGPGAAPFEIRAAVSFVEPGFYAFVAAAPSKVEMTVKFTSADGQVLDEITLSHQTPAQMMNPSSGGRFRSDGKALGRIVSNYILTRVNGG
jgi:hypothetical protein